MRWIAWVLAAMLAMQLYSAAGSVSRRKPQPAVPAFEPAILDLADRIWYPANDHPEASLLLHTLRASVAARRWSGAIVAAEQLTPLIPSADRRVAYKVDQPCQWRAAIATLHLYNGDPGHAISEAQKVFAAIPPAKAGFGRSFARQDAAYTMARAQAEAGNYKDAVRWLNQAPSEYWSGCGNCMEGERLRAHPLLTVWTDAQLPSEAAVRRLQAIQAGKFTPTKAQFQGAAGAAARQRQAAREEASLILGELHLRNGDQAAARAALTVASQGRAEAAFIARSRLAQLQAPRAAELPGL